MPDDRLFHKRVGHSEKVTSLSDFEFRVWHQYELSADDFGVMRFSAVTLQADNDALAKRPVKTVQRALGLIQEVGLVVTFDHQSRTYCAQFDWQNFQRVKHPRQTINPRPPDDVLATFTHATRQLFLYWPGKRKEGSENDSGNSSPIVSGLAGAGTRETANGLRLTANGKGVSGETKPAARLAFGGAVLEVPKFLDDEFVKRLNGHAFDLTAFYLALDQRLTQTGEAWDLRWIREQFAAESPSPERRRVEREPDERPFTQAERTKAERFRRSTWGGCRHEPRCETSVGCIARIITDWRSQEVPA